MPHIYTTCHTYNICTFIYNTFHTYNIKTGHHIQTTAHNTDTHTHTNSIYVDALNLKLKSPTLPLDQIQRITAFRHHPRSQSMHSCFSESGRVNGIGCRKIRKSPFHFSPNIYAKEREETERNAESRRSKERSLKNFT